MADHQNNKSPITHEGQKDFNRPEAECTASTSETNMSASLQSLLDSCPLTNPDLGAGVSGGRSESSSILNYHRTAIWKKEKKLRHLNVTIRKKIINVYPT